MPRERKKIQHVQQITQQEYLTLSQLAEKELEDFKSRLFALSTANEPAEPEAFEEPANNEVIPPWTKGDCIHCGSRGYVTRTQPKPVTAASAYECESCEAAQRGADSEREYIRASIEEQLNAWSTRLFKNRRAGEDTTSLNLCVIELQQVYDRLFK